MRSIAVATLLASAVAAAACHADPPPQAPAPPAAPSPLTSPAPPAPPASPASHPRRVISQTSIEILDPVQFDGVSSVIAPASHRTLDALAATFTADPDIQVVEVQAYGPDAAPAWRKALGEDRARALVHYLVARGVAPTRLRAAGAALPPSGADARPRFLIVWRTSQHPVTSP